MGVDFQILTGKSGEEPIQKYLVDGEKLLFEGDYLCATNQRIIYHRKEFIDNETFWDLDYKHISSMEFSSTSNDIILLLGVSSILLTVLSRIPTFKVINLDIATGTIISALLLLVWLLFKQNILEFHATGGEKQKITGIDKNSAQDIIRIVRSNNPKI